MAANGGRHFQIYIKTENYQTQFISQKHAYSYTFDKCNANNHLIGLFHEFNTFIRHFWKTINIHCESISHNLTNLLVPSLTFLNFQSSITFLFFCPICMKFAPNSLVLEILPFWLRLHCFQSFSFKITNTKYKISQMLIKKLI